jgi:predicted aspartyl protease
MNHKQALLEFFTPFSKVLNEDKDEKGNTTALHVEVKWQQADKVNGNNRFYPRALLQREIDRILPMANEGKIYGCSYHPEKEAEVDDVSHLWESFRLNEAGEAVGVVKVVPTEPRGKNVITILKNGGQLGMSSRGFGTLTKRERVVEGGTKVEYDEVNDDFKLKSPGDFVLSPSVIDAGTRKILESRWSKIEDSEEPMERKMNELKTLEELRKAHPELVKELDTKISEMESQITALSEERDQLKEDLEVTEELVLGYIDAAREAIRYFADLPGVVEGDDEEKPGDDEEDAEDVDGEEEEPTAEGKVPAGLAAYQAKKKKKAAPAADDSEGDDQSGKDNNEGLTPAEKELKELKEKIAADELAAKVASTINEAVKGEDDVHKKFILEKLVAIKFAKVEDVAAKYEEAKTEVGKMIAEIERAKILATGTTPKGHIENPEGSAKLTEEQKETRWRAALASGYKGTLEEYVKTVLSL